MLQCPQGRAGKRRAVPCYLASCACLHGRQRRRHVRRGMARSMQEPCFSLLILNERTRLQGRAVHVAGSKPCIESGKQAGTWYTVAAAGACQVGSRVLPAQVSASYTSPRPLCCSEIIRRRLYAQPTFLATLWRGTQQVMRSPRAVRLRVTRSIRKCAVHRCQVQAERGR